MLKKLFSRAVRWKGSAISDTSKASELTLRLEIHKANANSGSPEFFVQKIVPFTISHPKNPKVSETQGYECIGRITRKSDAGDVLSDVPACLVFGVRAWSLFERGRAFTAVLSAQREKVYVTAFVLAHCQGVRPRTFVVQKGIAS